MGLKKYIPFYKRNLALAIPVMITQAGQMMVQFADSIMVGHLGTSQFAGVGFASAIFYIGFVFCSCFTQGLIPYIGQNYGRGEHSKVSQYFSNGILLNVVMCGLIIGIMFGIIPFMDKMGQDPKILGYAVNYYKIMIYSLVPSILFYMIRNLTEGIGNTKFSMQVTLVCNILNIFLNWVMIFGHFGVPAMGVDGAAWATFISRVMMLIIGITVVLSGKQYKRYFKEVRFSSINSHKLKELLHTSIPIGFQGLVEMTTFSLIGIMVGWFGQEAMAAHQAANTIVTFSFMVAQGVGVAATIRVSHQFGEGRYMDARMAGFAASHISIALMICAGITFVVFNDLIPYIFTSDPHVAEITGNLLYVAAAFQIFDATQLSALASLRALADVKWPLVLSIIAYYFVSIPLGYICGAVVGWGPVGVWFGILFGLLFAAILFLLRFNRITREFIPGPRVDYPGTE